MLQIFKTNRLFQSLFFIPYLILLRWYGIYHEVPTDFENGNILYNSIINAVVIHPTNSMIIAGVLVFFQAVVLNLIANQQKLPGENNLLTGLFYVLVSAISIYFMGFSPALLANTFLLFALSSLFQIYKTKEASALHFQAGFSLAIASLLYGSLVLFFIFGIAAILIMRSAELKELLQYVSGYAVPYILMFTYFFYSRKVDYFWNDILNSFDIFSISSLGMKDYYAIGILLILVFVSVLNYGKLIRKQGIKARKNILLLLLFTLVAIVSIFIQSQVGMEHLIVLAIPLAAFLGILFTRMKSVFWSETWHILLVIAILLGHFLWV